MSDSVYRSDRSLNKVEIEVERHLLETTVRLSDGSEGLVFSRGPKNDANLFLYNCHLCGVANLPGERCLQTHIAGRKHQRRLVEPTIDAAAFRAPLTKNQVNMSIAPGEPVPPGFEDEVRAVPQLQPFLNGYKSSPLLGLEYVVELCGAAESEPSYVCMLCDKRGDPRSIIAHITSYNHRLKYLDKYFPSVVKEISRYRYNPDARNIMPPLVQTICQAIEDHHGRLALSVHEYFEYQKNNIRILQNIIRDKHFTEKKGPTFTDIVNHKKIEEQLKAGKVTIAINLGSKPKDTKRNKVDSPRNMRDNLDEISSSESESGLNRQSPRSKLNRRRNRSSSVDRFGKRSKRTRSPSLSLSPPRRGGGMPRVHRSPPFDRVTSRRAPESRAVDPDKQKKDRYKSMVEAAIQESEKQLKEYEKNPEKHPLYPEEWKLFWNRRYKELQAEKKDPNKYDYKPEWIIFWTKRMKELHQDAIDSKKKEIRELCGLDKLSPANLKDKLEVIDISDEETSPLTVSPVRSDRDKRDKMKYSREHSREHERERDRNRDRPYGHRGAEALPEYYHGSSTRDYYPSHATQRYPKVRYIESEKYPKYEPDKKEEEEEDTDDGPLTVVAVLRLLTALEEHLGSLGPKVIDLLAKALALEKIKANSSEEMLLNDDTSVFFETVKEKLKGQILAGVLDTNKIRAVKRAVKNIAAILYQATSKETSKPDSKEEENPVKAKLLKTDILDRPLIASKLAAALVGQGKTDVSKDDMDRLINVFILIVKLSKERNAHVEVKDVLLELGIEVNAFDEDDVLSNISKIESKGSAASANNATSSLDSLTDSDLQTLLQNFKHLSSEEQHHLIAHLKKLESTDPIRVEKLRKFVDVTDLKPTKLSPRPEKLLGVPKSNFSDDDFERKKPKLIDSDDDDDYNFDEVVKAASNNVRGSGHNKSNDNARMDSESRDPDHEMSNLSMGSVTSAATNMSLANTQNLIANLLGSLQQNTSKAPIPGGNAIPTIGSGQNRNPSFNQNEKPSSLSNFQDQSQPNDQRNINSIFSSHNFNQQPMNTFESTPFSNNQMAHNQMSNNQISSNQMSNNQMANNQMTNSQLLQQGFDGRGPSGPNRSSLSNPYNSRNIQNMQNMQNVQGYPNSQGIQNPTGMSSNQNMQNNFYNQFTRNSGPTPLMQLNMLNAQDQQKQQQQPQPTFFNRSAQNPGSFF